MATPSLRVLGIVFVGVAASCAANPGTRRGDGGGGGADGGDGSTFDVPSRDGTPPGTDGESCEPPDMLIVLDRTMSMSSRPSGGKPADTTSGHTETKWYIAVTAIEDLTARIDETLRFGLELFPRDPGGGQCVTLSQQLNDVTATNARCEAGEVLVSPDLDTGDAIDAAVDIESTLLCRSTPIAAGLETALATLTAIKVSGRDQHVLLVSDGEDKCDEAAVVPAVHALTDAGVKTWAIGFDASGAIDRDMLNSIACAGLTASDMAVCLDDGTGHLYAPPSLGTDLFLEAGDPASLLASFEAVAGEVCCGCPI